MGMERNIKTESAIRKIPVHPELIRFGLFEYAEAVRYLGGWSRSGADVADQYGSGFSLAHLSEFMSRVSYPGLTIDEGRPFLGH